MKSNEPTSIKEIIQDMSGQPVAIILGRITGFNPLEVRIINDDKLVLNDNTVINSNRFKNWTLGDRTIFAYILTFAQGKSYYILDTYTED